MRVQVRLQPEGDPVPPSATAAVIDVLRATSTLTTALANGAAGVLAALTPDEARSLRDRTAGSLLCGEREGKPLPGFDLGNSPAEYRADRVAGRMLVFASTNGSRAIRHAERARDVVAAAFVNAIAVVERLARARHVVLVCAGERGRFSLEDTGCAGWIAARLVERGGRLDGAAARLAVAMAPRSQDEVRTLVQGSQHARYLRTLGESYARDIETCATLDLVPHVFAVTRPNNNKQ